MGNYEQDCWCTVQLQKTFFSNRNGTSHMATFKAQTGNFSVRPVAEWDVPHLPKKAIFGVPAAPPPDNGTCTQKKMTSQGSLVLIKIYPNWLLGTTHHVNGGLLDSCIFELSLPKGIVGIRRCANDHVPAPVQAPPLRSRVQTPPLRRRPRPPAALARHRPGRRLRAALNRHPGICLFWAKTNETKKTTPVVDARAAALTSTSFQLALQQFKQSLILSHALNATLLLMSEQLEHRYLTSQIFNGAWDEVAFDMRNTYRMKDRLAEMAECTGILGVDKCESMEDLNGCIGAWLRERLAPATLPALPPLLTLPPTCPVTVGVHIRWATPACPAPVQLTIVMENAEEQVLPELHKTNYTLLDSGDASADMHALAVQNISLLGESSWAVIVHLVAPPGLTVVEFLGGCVSDGTSLACIDSPSARWNKYLYTPGFGCNVIMLHDYAPESLLQGPWVAGTTQFSILNGTGRKYHLRFQNISPQDHDLQNTPENKIAGTCSAPHPTPRKCDIFCYLSAPGNAVQKIYPYPGFIILEPHIQLLSFSF
ncbi:hypothetical protein FB451DRAFT_1163927 [Mycena latifolia]|nr:hypothetical protein FB451DRAFT_1163927 [Mycena latifolia]